MPAQGSLWHRGENGAKCKSEKSNETRGKDQAVSKGCGMLVWNTLGIQAPLDVGCAMLPIRNLFFAWWLDSYLAS